MRFELSRGKDTRRPVAKMSQSGERLYLQGGAGIPEGKHVVLNTSRCLPQVDVNGTLDVTCPMPDSRGYVDIFEGDSVTITF